MTPISLPLLLNFPIGFGLLAVGLVCFLQAYNGIGPIALWDVTLLLDSDTTDPLPHYDPRLHPAPNVSYTYHELGLCNFTQSLPLEI